MLWNIFLDLQDARGPRGQLGWSGISSCQESCARPATTPCSYPIFHPGERTSTSRCPPLRLSGFHLNSDLFLLSYLFRFVNFLVETHQNYHHLYQIHFQRFQLFFRRIMIHGWNHAVLSRRLISSFSFAIFYQSLIFRETPPYSHSLSSLGLLCYYTSLY